VRGDGDADIATNYVDNRFTPTCVGTAKNRLRKRATSTGSPPRAWGRPTCQTS